MRRNTHLRSNCLNHFASNNCHIEPNLFPWIHPVSMLSIYITSDIAFDVQIFTCTTQAPNNLPERTCTWTTWSEWFRWFQVCELMMFIPKDTFFSFKPFNRYESTKEECRVWFFFIVHTLSRGRYIQVIGYCVNRNVFYIQYTIA